jgi:hypothetical protein
VNSRPNCILNQNGAGGLRSETNPGNGWPLRPGPAVGPTCSASAGLSLEWRSSGTTAAGPSSSAALPGPPDSPTRPASCRPKVAGGGMGAGKGGGNARPSRSDSPSEAGASARPHFTRYIVIKSTSASPAITYDGQPAIQLPQSGIPERYRRALWLNSKLAEALAETGLRHLASRLGACHTRFRRYRCSNGHSWAWPYRPCNLRVCAFEARLRSARAAKRWGPVLGALDRPKHLVLAMPNVPQGELKDGIRRLWGAFARLRRKSVWALVRGAVVALEVTFNRRAKTWHPHLHAILDAPYLPWESLMAAWREASGAKQGESRTCWIGAADSGAIRELVKYVTKMASLVRYPEALEEFLRAVKRMRMLRSYGSLYRLRLALEPAGCPDCGLPGEALDVIGLDQVTWDACGVLRPREPP